MTLVFVFCVNLLCLICVEIHFFDQSVYDFVAKLDANTQAKTVRMIELLEKFGDKISMPHSKKIAHRLFELRIRGRTEIRIIYTFFKEGIVLLHSFQKKSQKMPKGELLVAKNRLFQLDRI